MNDKNKVGRPSKYGPEILEKTFEYLHIYQELGHVIPSATGLAFYLGVTRKTVHMWANDDDKAEFCYTFDRIQQKQELDSLSGGLNSTYNPQIAKLVLHNHGYHDKQDLNTQGAVTVVIDSKDAGNL